MHTGSTYHEHPTDEQFTRLTRKGQITVPIAIRKALGLREGDTVALTLTGGETAAVRLRAVRSVAMLTFGSVPGAPNVPTDPAALHRAFEEGVAAEVAAEDRR